MDSSDDGISGSSQQILHFHGLYNSEFLVGSHLISNTDIDRYDSTRHWANQSVGEVDFLGNGHKVIERELVRAANSNFILLCGEYVTSVKNKKKEKREGGKEGRGEPLFRGIGRRILCSFC